MRKRRLKERIQALEAQVRELIERLTRDEEPIERRATGFSAVPGQRTIKKAAQER